jgi:hypothetical protein
VFECAGFAGGSDRFGESVGVCISWITLEEIPSEEGRRIVERVFVEQEGGQASGGDDIGEAVRGEQIHGSQRRKVRPVDRFTALFAA